MPICELCKRTVERTSRHHLTPKQKGGRHGPCAELCQPCHSTLHHTFSNKELAQNYNSIEKLEAAEALKKYLQWIRKRNIQKLSF